MRRWLLAFMVGTLIVLALPTIIDVWQVNQAGILLNRAIVMGSDAAAKADTKAGANGSTKSSRLVAVGGDYLMGPQAKALLQQSISLMASAAARGPHTPAREVPIWRTYGAAASLLPSDHAFELLSRSSSAGRLDWYGELWLGEVASSTGHWTDAASAYRRVDVSNLLVYRAEMHIQSGRTDLALRELDLAKESLDALVDREKARLLLLDRTGTQPSALAGVLQQPAERATTLSRIGHGLLSLGRPKDALPVLEEGLTVAAMSSPGATAERNLRLDLAEVLAQTLPEAPAGFVPMPGYSYYPSSVQLARLNGLIRIRALVHQALSFDHSAVACTLAGRILDEIGDDEAGVSLLADAVRLDPTLPTGYLMLGDWYDSHGMAYEAYDLYARASKLLPADPSITSALAVSTFKTRPHAEALPLLERASGLQGAGVYVFAFLGDCYVEAGRPADAQAIWQQGLSRFPDAKTLVVRLSLLAQSEAPSPSSTVVSQ